jgi:hypothetical protein
MPPLEAANQRHTGDQHEDKGSTSHKAGLQQALASHEQNAGSASHKAGLQQALAGNDNRGAAPGASCTLLCSRSRENMAAMSTRLCLVSRYTVPRKFRGIESCGGTTVNPRKQHTHEESKGQRIGWKLEVS